MSGEGLDIMLDTLLGWSFSQLKHLLSSCYLTSLGRGTVEEDE